MYILKRNAPGVLRSEKKIIKNQSAESTERLANFNYCKQAIFLYTRLKKDSQFCLFSPFQFNSYWSVDREIKSALSNSVVKSDQTKS